MTLDPKIIIASLIRSGVSREEAAVTADAHIATDIPYGSIHDAHVVDLCDDMMRGIRLRWDDAPTVAVATEVMRIGRERGLIPA